MKHVWAIVAVISCMAFAFAGSYNASDRIPKYRAKISKTLIGVSKKHADCRTELYEAIDDLASMCEYCSKTLDRSTSFVEHSQQENAQLLSDISSLEKKTEELELKLAEHKRTIDTQQEIIAQMRAENSELAVQAQDVERKERDINQRMRALEATLAAPHQSVVSTPTFDAPEA